MLSLWLTAAWTPISLSVFFLCKYWKNSAPARSVAIEIAHPLGPVWRNFSAFDRKNTDFNGHSGTVPYRTGRGPGQVKSSQVRLPRQIQNSRPKPEQHLSVVRNVPVHWPQIASVPGAVLAPQAN